MKHVECEYTVNPPAVYGSRALLGYPELTPHAWADTPNMPRERQFLQLSTNTMRCSDVAHRTVAEYAITVLLIPFQGEGMRQHERSQVGDILVVDDNRRIVDLLVEILSVAGYAARGAHDGQEALDAILADPPALVLLDWQMPRMSGAELIEALAQMGFADLPIIVITASPIESLRITDASNVAYMAKSFTLDELLASVTGVMCGQRTQRDTEHASE